MARATDGKGNQCRQGMARARGRPLTGRQAGKLDKCVRRACERSSRGERHDMDVASLRRRHDRLPASIRRASFVLPSHLIRGGRGGTHEDLDDAGLGSGSPRGRRSGTHRLGSSSTLHITIVPIAVEAAVLSYTFSGIAPPGAYTWYSVLTRPGTLEFVTPLQQVAFTLEATTPTTSLSQLSRRKSGPG